MASHESRTLRAALFRISAASHKDLLTIIPSVAGSLRDCSALLSRAPSSGKDAGDASLLHKFRTQITTLLNAKSSEARWAGTILAKAAIEVGGYKTLSNCGVWTRAMLQNLNKPDPASSKKIVVITLTRIFDLTDQHQTLVRELTTLLLKDFIPACFHLVSSKGNDAKSTVNEPSRVAMLSTVLDSFAHLLPMHANIFRPHLSQLRKLLANLIDPSTAGTTNTSIQVAARRLFVLLPFSAPKPKTNCSAITNGFATVEFDQWRAMLTSIHTTTSLVFRSTYEDWSPLPSSGNGIINAPNDMDLTSVAHADPLSLPPWHGIHNGLSRLRSLLALLRQAICSPTPDQSSIPLANITDLVVRLCTMVVPLETKSSKSKPEATISSIRANDQISQTERDALLAGLPSIHTSVMELVSALIIRCQGSSAPLHDLFLDQIVWVFEREKFNSDLRASCYAALRHILRESGSGMKKPTVQQLTVILNSCCEDLLSSSNTNASTNEKGTNGLTADSLVSLGKPSASHFKTTKTSIAGSRITAASDLLTTALSSISPSCFPNRLRATLDRTAILTQNNDAMLASVLNPPTSGSGSAAVPTSVLPFLARAAPESLAAEALLRPRLPVVKPSENGLAEDLDSDANEEMAAASPNGDNAEDIDENYPGLSPTSLGPSYAAEAIAAIGPGVDEVDQPDPVPTSTTNAQKSASSAQALSTSTKRPATDSSEQTSAIPEHKRARIDHGTSPSPQDRSVIRDDRPDPLKPEAESVPQPVVASTSSKPATSGTKQDPKRSPNMPSPAPVSAPTPKYPPGEPESSDEDDFVIPEINMDPDTEDEEDEDAS